MAAKGTKNAKKEIYGDDRMYRIMGFLIWINGPVLIRVDSWFLLTRKKEELRINTKKTEIQI